MKKIKYIVTDEIYFENKDYLPQPIKNYIPNWYKNIRAISLPDTMFKDWDKRVMNVKSCPSFIKLYQEGYVLVAPCDIRISYDAVDDIWTWRTPIVLFNTELSNNPETITLHTRPQMTEYLPSTAKTRLVFKLNLPIFAQVPLGYNIRVLPVPFAYNNDFVASPGILKPSNSPQINILLEYISQKDEILIKQGTPLAVHVPYKKEKFKLIHELYNPKKHRSIRYKTEFKNQGRFHSSYLRNHKE